MKKITIILLLICTVAFANKTEVRDTVIIKQTVVDTLHMVNAVPDSLMWAKAQQFYKDSFWWLLAVIGIFATLIVGIGGFVNVFSWLKSNKEIERIRSDMKGIENKLSENGKKQDENLKEIETHQSKMTNLFRSMGSLLFTSALERLEKNEIDMYFFYLYGYFGIYISNEIKLGEKELGNLKSLNFYLEKIKEKRMSVKNGTVSLFHKILLEFKMYCEETNAMEHLEQVNILRKKLDDLNCGKQQETSP